jgi:uncharacterized protein YfaS (alpha-2-macroglobulin family)
MAHARGFRWHRRWIGLALGMSMIGAVLALFLLGPSSSQAHAAGPRPAAGYQTTERLTLAVTLPGTAGARGRALLEVQLIDPDGQVLGDARREVEPAAEDTSHRFEFPAARVAADKLTVRCRLGEDKPVEVSLQSILLVKAHETALSSGQEFFAGSQAALRCQMHGVKSVSKTVPLSGATVSVRLRSADGKEVMRTQGQADKDGVAVVQLSIPPVPPGSYKMEVVTQSALGEEKLERDVKIKTAPKVLLVTDKPLYQPGQRMHLRALALQSFDLRPVAEKEITFEVEDAKGNKVFKRSLETSAYGIASADFDLADEVNAGDYHIRAILGEHTADKTVSVRPYVLPKFKAEIKADKKFYLPKETVHADLQADYFFGKPVARGKVKVTASTFDVAFKDFQTWEGTTDEQGHAKFEIKLPDYFVGLPLEKGNALVRLEIKVTDMADHSETIHKTYPVSAQPIQVSLIPEGGRLLPGLENRVFAAAVYPDGSPAVCDVKVWAGKEAKGNPLAALKTNEAGLADFRLTPKAEQFRQAGWGQRSLEMLGGRLQTVGMPIHFFDVTAEAKDAHGETARQSAALTSEVFGENVLLRLDKAIYKGGEGLNIDIRTSAGLPTVYLDVVKAGQTVLTKWLDVKDGKAASKLDLPEALFGTLEVHAYQMLGHGEIIRDSRVIYVNAASDLKIDVRADKDVYTPGGSGTFHFHVTDAAGKPAAAALGVLIVDEAVYALQEMQPGLEKVYFTLQEELLKPQVQVLYKTADSLQNLVREPVLADARQQAAEVLLTAVRPKLPARWEVDPATERRQKVEQKIQQIGWGLYQYAQKKAVLVQDKKSRRWSFRPDLLAELDKSMSIPSDALNDPLGGRMTLEMLAALEKDFTPEHLGIAATQGRMQQLIWAVAALSEQRRAQWTRGGKWDVPDTAVADAAKIQGFSGVATEDAWGRPLRLVRRDKPGPSPWGPAIYGEYQLVSAGPDGKLGTADDVVLSPANRWQHVWWIEDEARRQQQGQGLVAHRRNLARNGAGFPMDAAKGGRPGGFGRGGAMPPPAAKAMPTRRAPAGPEPQNVKLDEKAKPGDSAPPAGESAAAAPPRLREYFPETLLWQPALITDERGVAELQVPFADSITTWRLTASASSRGGRLGGVDKPLRVFQDFFVDIDLPVALTQNDEVAFPLAVYNYLKEPQTVKLTLHAEPWFELLDSQGLVRSLDLKPNEVTSVKYRIRAKKVGHFPVTVNAAGSKTSDAVKRSVEVLPDGKKVEQVATDRLSGTLTQAVVIPDNAIPDASRLFVKVYPGVFSQVLDGAEGILRMPGGCFEQTSSSAYPNILVADYIKKTRTGSPEVLMRAEQFLNAGYQRLLTFERPGGGFDWWGSGEPLIWLSAYGLHEFKDMARVWPIDRGVIDRTQAWLLKQQDADGTWSKIGATHGESIERMGDPKLLLTSYVAWSLLDSGLKSPQLAKSIEYIREHARTAENAYILALAANALAAWDAKDDSTHEVLTKVLQKLEKQKQDRPDWKACCFPAAGQSLAYARGDSMTVETTALAVLAMLKSGQFANSVNQALVYLVKSKDPHGTWGSTQATILALKALVAAAGGVQHKGKVSFAVVVNGKEVRDGEVTEANADVMQQFDLSEHLRTGRNEVAFKVEGETSLTCQVVGRHFEPWGPKAAAAPPIFEVAVEYDRTKLSTKDLLRAKATLRYHGKEPTAMVMVDLGIPPGFTADAGDFAEMVGAKKVQKFSLTARQATLYLGDVKPGAVQTFEYVLRPKYPVRAKTPPAVAYEYYAPANRATAAPVEVVVEDAAK